MLAHGCGRGDVRAFSVEIAAVVFVEVVTFGIFFVADFGGGIAFVIAEFLVREVAHSPQHAPDEQGAEEVPNDKNSSHNASMLAPIWQSSVNLQLAFSSIV